MHSHYKVTLGEYPTLSGGRELMYSHYKVTLGESPTLSGEES